MKSRLIEYNRRVSHKVYTCVWCGETIPIYTNHVYHKTATNKTITANRWHEECIFAAEKHDEETFNREQMNRPYHV